MLCVFAVNTYLLST